MLGSTVVNPTYATVTPSGQSFYTYATPAPSVTKALEVPPSGTTRVAAVWYSGSSFTIDVNVASGHSYDLELYLLDYDGRGRSETVTLSDANTSAMLNSQTVSSFASGKYLTWAISGNVLITITTLTGSSATRSSAVCSSMPIRRHLPWKSRLSPVAARLAAAVNSPLSVNPQRAEAIFWLCPRQESPGRSSPPLGHSTRRALRRSDHSAPGCDRHCRLR